MIEWLRGEGAEPVIALGDRTLPIVLTRKARAKRMILRLSEKGDAVQVTLPRYGTKREAIAFAASRTAWLEAQLAKRPPPREKLADGTFLYCGKRVQLVCDPKAPRAPRLEGMEGDMRGSRLVIGGPEASVPKRLETWLRSEATRLMDADLAFYCAAAGVPVPALALSRARRRWGSCSSSGTVRLNWRLVQASDPVRRSVVAHEVAHLVHFDHSPAFHALLGSIYEDDLPAADAWLKREGRSLYHDFD
ncbi:M48 family metallopeptidase [Qipengyuania atrilutea]|uniref:M48 family metallopeptidase n=1 Tax=Qipengyuania atrilutea TaxID=2744473 RepID=A0A850H086_9SPHN|nr:SprT family zinc-dependent metalloprotease [Actirhodobacter atriluteus]NVD45344.1 M48 family metallopeptidase [Actirhodobacter atriluteus]